MNRHDKVHHFIRLVQVVNFATIFERDYIVIDWSTPCQLYRSSSYQTNKNYHNGPTFLQPGNPCQLQSYSSCQQACFTSSNKLQNRHLQHGVGQQDNWDNWLSSLINLVLTELSSNSLARPKIGKVQSQLLLYLGYKDMNINWNTWHPN